MIELIVLNYLKTKLDVPISMEEIEEPEYVLIQKTGGSKENKIFSSMFAIQSFADSLFKASELNEKVKDAMDEIVSCNEVSKCSLNSDYNYTDTTKKKYRYQAIFDLVHY